MKFETRKAVVEIDSSVDVAPDRRIEGAINGQVAVMLEQCYEQGFAREETSPLLITISPL